MFVLLTGPLDELLQGLPLVRSLEGHYYNLIHGLQEGHGIWWKKHLEGKFVSQDSRLRGWPGL
jgi:hypothetical protein